MQENEQVSSTSNTAQPTVSSNHPEQETNSGSERVANATGISRRKLRRLWRENRVAVGLSLWVVVGMAVLGLWLSFSSVSAKEGTGLNQNQPLTDVAPPPPSIDVSASEAPDQRARAKEQGNSSQKANASLSQPDQAATSLNSATQVQVPAQLAPTPGTKTLVSPGKPVPPDPFTKPQPVKDPQRQANPSGNPNFTPGT